MVLGEPVGLVAFYPDHAIPRTPSVAVAAGNAVYVYRSLRPYLKFTLPALPVDAGEAGVWAALREKAAAGGGGGGGEVGAGDAAAALRALTGLRDAGARLTARSLAALAAAGGGDAAGARAALAAGAGRPLVAHSCVTALGAVAREREGAAEASSLIVGTEAGAVLLLDAVGSAVAAAVALPAAPTHIVASGALAGEHRILVAARDARVYAIRDGRLLPTRIEPPARIVAVALAAEGAVLAVACADGSLTGFAARGGGGGGGADAAPLWRVALPAPPVALARMTVRRDRGADCVAVALEGGALHVYNGAARVAALALPDTAVALAFGQYGREGNALAVVLRSGSLALHMLRRTADLGGKGEGERSEPPKRA
jgi:Bardet-Biedl syndrome 1 protein